MDGRAKYLMARIRKDAEKLKLKSHSEWKGI
jgi:hypothetical protein